MSSSEKSGSSSGVDSLIISPYELSQTVGFPRRVISKFIYIYRNLFTGLKKSPLKLDTTDSVALIFFMAVGMMTRLFRIQFPQEVVFDEVHFGNFTNWYIRGQYFHDIHPPLAKLIMAGVAKFAGYNGEYNFGSVTQYPSMTYVTLRITPAFFGALCVPLTYLVMRTLHTRHFAATIAAFMVLFDVMLIIEARHILSDGILHFFSCLAIFSIFLFERYPNIFALAFEGFCLGCVASCKYTSGGIVLLAFLRQFDLSNILQFLRNPLQQLPSFARCIILTFIIIAIHFMCFWIHLSVLPYYPESPVGMPDCIRKSLVDKSKPDWNVRKNAPSMLKRIISLIFYMHAGNMKVGHSHPYASPWYSWPLATGKWLLFWTKDGKHLICMGNILLWWPVFLSIFLDVFRIFSTKDYNSEVSATFFGYFLSLLPFMLIPRDLFIYHYAIPLIFGIAHLNLFIERFLPPVSRGFFYMLFVFMAGFGYIKWNPWAYGLTTPDFRFLVWNSNWA